MAIGNVVSAREFNDVVSNLSSCDIRVYKNNYATSGTYTVYASNLFGSISEYESFEAYMVLSGTFSASHWGRMRQTYQSLNKITQPSKGVFKVQTSASKSGWGSGSQSALYYDLIIVGKLKEEIELIDRWSSSLTYKLGDVVSVKDDANDITFWLSLQDNNRNVTIPNTDWWQEVTGYIDRGDTSFYEEYVDRTRLGEGRTNPALSPTHIKIDNPYASDGVFWLKPNGVAEAFPCYCKFDKYGAWALVWSNLRGFRNRPTTGITYNSATNGTAPLWNIPSGIGLVDENGNPLINGNKELWEVYTPLNLWNKLMGDKKGKLQYEWRHNYGSKIDKMLVCDIDPFNSSDLYRLNISNAKTGTQAGLWSYHRGRRFSTYDSDNNGGVHNCASYYSNTPWWYGYCWSGSINGGGENNGHSYYNGAYWYSSCRHWGVSSGHGAGNGWLYIQFT